MIEDSNMQKLEMALPEI